MILCGIDCGKSGAVAITNEDTIDVIDIVTLHDGTLDCFWLYEILSFRKVSHAIIEGVYRPNSLVALAGEVMACCKLADVILTIVPVCTWKKNILGENTSDKQVSIKWAKENYPKVNICRQSPKMKKLVESHDKSEALALWEFLRRTLTPSQKKSGKAS